MNFLYRGKLVELNFGIYIITLKNKLKNQDFLQFKSGHNFQQSKCYRLNKDEKIYEEKTSLLNFYIITFVKSKYNN